MDSFWALTQSRKPTEWRKPFDHFSNKCEDMSKAKKISKTIPIECSSANVVAVVEKWLHPDTANDIDALDCKSDAQNFERLLRYFIEKWARRHEMTPERFCELVPEQELRAAIR